MALMSLQESWNIYQLKKRRQLWMHPLFQTARSWQRSDRDQFGAVHRLNDSEYDDDTPPFLGGCRDAASGCACICPCLRSSNYVAANDGGQLLGGGPIEQSQTVRPLAGLPAAKPEELRGQRNILLDNIEQRQKEQQKTVRELESEQGNV